MAIENLPDKYLYALMKNYGIADTLPENLQSQFGSMDEQELNSLSADMANPDFWKSYDMEATGNFVNNTNAAKPKEVVKNPNPLAVARQGANSSYKADSEEMKWWDQRQADWNTIAKQNPTLSVDQVNQLAERYRVGKDGKKAESIKYNPDDKSSESMKGQDYIGYQDLLDKFLDVGPNNPAVAKEEQVGTLMDKYNEYTKANPDLLDNTPTGQLTSAARSGPLGQYIDKGIITESEAANMIAGTAGGVDANVINSYIERLNANGANIQPLDNNNQQFQVNKFQGYQDLINSGLISSEEAQKQKEIASNLEQYKQIYANLAGSESGRNSQDYKNAVDYINQNNTVVDEFNQKYASYFQQSAANEANRVQTNQNTRYSGLNEQDLRDRTSLSDFLGMNLPGVNGMPQTQPSYDAYGRFVGSQYNQNQLANSLANGYQVPQGQDVYTLEGSKALTDTYGSTPEFEQVTNNSPEYDEFLKQFRTDKKTYVDQIKKDPNTALPSIFMGFGEWSKNKYPNGLPSVIETNKKGGTGMGGTFI